MIAVKFTIELEIGLFFLLQSALPLLLDRPLGDACPGHKLQRMCNTH